MTIPIPYPEKRPKKFPFNDLQLGKNKARHHIIPQGDLVKIAVDILNDAKHNRMYVTKIMDEVKKHPKNWNLGTSTIYNLTENLFNTNVTQEDIYAWILVVMWLPGNIVIGPSPDKRKSDPEDAFDIEAFKHLVDYSAKAGRKYDKRVSAINILWRERSSPLIGRKVEFLATLGEGDFNEVGWVVKEKK